MLTNILFLFSISSGSAFAAAFWNKKYADALPLTVSGIVLVQFLFGLAGFLEAGFLAVLGCSAGLWAAAVIRTLNKRNAGEVIHSFFSREFWVFLGLFAGLNVFLTGMQVHEWDEFSHWATVVKAMVQEGCLGLDPRTHLLCGDYPPAMALFQYFLQRLYIFSGKGGFSEWRLYLAYLTLSFSFLLPLIRRIRTKGFWGTAVVALCFVLVPLPFYENYYHSLYIDAFLGILLGAGLAMIVLEKNKQDRCYGAYMYSLCFMLTLAKLSGILFSVMIISVWLADRFLENREFKKAGSAGAAAFLVIGVPNLLWNGGIKYFGTQPVEWGEIQPGALWGIFTGTDMSYRKEVWDVFKLALFDDTGGGTRFPVRNLGLSVNYFTLLVFFMLLAWAAWHFIRKKSRPMARTAALVLAAMAFVWLFFYISLGITYLFRFDEGTALNLGSYARYTHTVYLAMWLLLITLILWLAYEYFQTSLIKVAGLCILLVITPAKPAAEFFFRDPVSASVESRKPYTELGAKIRSFAGADSRVYFICQDAADRGAAYWQTSFEARPARTQRAQSGWALGSGNPEWYVSDLTASEWQKLLLAEYDYVAVYVTDPYFCGAFSGLFADPEEIQNNSLYKINKETGFLELCK